MEKKKNIIVDGTFTKITYSDENMCMNGVYLHFPFIISGASAYGNRQSSAFSPQNDKNKYKHLAFPSHSYLRSGSKHSVDIDMNIAHNASFMSAIYNIETEILSYFKNITGINKNINYSLRNQMMTGSLNVSSSPISSPASSCIDGMVPAKCNNSETCEPEQDKYVLKISGIWETATAIGITYKFIRVRRFSPCFT